MTVKTKALQHAPRIALYVAAGLVAIGSASLASQIALTGTSAPTTEPYMLTVYQPETLPPPPLASVPERAVNVVAAAPAAAAPILPRKAPVRAAEAPKADAEMTVSVAAIPPKPLARPCMDDCRPRAAAAQPTAEPVASLAMEPEFIAPGIARPEQVASADIEDGPVPPMPVGPSVHAEGGGVLARGGQLVGSVIGWSGGAVAGMVREVRSRTF